MLHKKRSLQRGLHDEGDESEEDRGHRHDRWRARLLPRSDWVRAWRTLMTTMDPGYRGCRGSLGKSTTTGCRGRPGDLGTDKETKATTSNSKRLRFGGCRACRGLPRDRLCFVALRLADDLAAEDGSGVVGDAINAAVSRGRVPRPNSRTMARSLKPRASSARASSPPALLDQPRRQRRRRPNSQPVTTPTRNMTVSTTQVAASTLTHSK